MKRMGLVVLVAALGAGSFVGADTLHVNADTSIRENAPDQDGGRQPSVTVSRVGSDIHGYVRFDLSPLAGLPRGTPIHRAMLRLWAGNGLDHGSIEVRPVLDPWDEATLTWNTAPALAEPVAAVAIGAGDGSQYVMVDVTVVVQQWLDGTLANQGMALLPATDGLRLETASKEADSPRRPMELEVVLLAQADGAGASTAEPGRSPTAPGGVQESPTASTYWSLTGDAGTSAGTNFLGTTDDQPLELHVARERALRLEPNATSPNLIGGFSGNSVDSGIVGAVIAGGGRSGQGLNNHVGADWGTVSGGFRNHATGYAASIGGGHMNWATGGGATVTGGVGNISTATGAVTSGISNEATADFTTVSGGVDNAAVAQYATVPGGYLNIAGGDYSFAAGRFAQVRTPAVTGDADGDQGAFVWADVGGGFTPFYSTGPNQFLVRASGGVAINTNTPVAGSALTVNGNTTFTGNATVTGNQFFGFATRQMLNLWGTAYGIGVQSYGTYFRSDGEFSWFRGGTHNDGMANPGGGTRHMRLDAAGNLRVAGTVSGGGADFAEMLPARDGVEPGDVLAIGPDGRLTRSTEPYQRSLAGAYSTKPGLLGGAADGDDLTGKIPLAVTGVVPVKVTAENGPIAPGDSLTSSSTPGRAMKAAMIRVGGVAFFPSGMILGKALEPLDSGEGLIQVLVMLQ